MKIKCTFDFLLSTIARVLGKLFTKLINKELLKLFTELVNINMRH